MGNDEIYINVYRSKIVNQNSKTPAVVVGEQVIEQGCFTSAEVAAEDRDWDKSVG